MTFDTRSFIAVALLHDIRYTIIYSSSTSCYMTFDTRSFIAVVLLHDIQYTIIYSSSTGT